MSDVKSKMLKILASSINLKGLANALVDEVIEEALKKVVADSATAFDDMAMAALWPVLEKEVKDLINEKLDLEKILGLKDEGMESGEESSSAV